ncbi:MAG: hypothetical protein ACK4NY_04555 [Spirosomataceae bacterium]
MNISSKIDSTKKSKRKDKITKSRLHEHVIYADPNRWQTDLNSGNHPDA